MRNAFQSLVVFTAIFGLGLGAAFSGGAYWERRNRPEATATPAAAVAPTGSTGAVGAGAAGAAPGAAAAQATTGVVEEISGDTITVRTAAGGTVPIKLQPDTQVRRLADATSGDIRPGLNVIIQGQPDLDGKVAARSVQITGVASGGAAGQSGGRGGQPPDGQGQRSPGPRPTGTAAP